MGCGLLLAGNRAATAPSDRSVSHAMAHRLSHRRFGLCGARCEGGASVRPAPPQAVGLGTAAAKRHERWELDPTLVVTLAALEAGGAVVALGIRVASIDGTRNQAGAPTTGWRGSRREPLRALVVGDDGS